MIWRLFHWFFAVFCNKFCTPNWFHKFSGFLPDFTIFSNFFHCFGPFLIFPDFFIAFLWLFYDFLVKFTRRSEKNWPILLLFGLNKMNLILTRLASENGGWIFCCKIFFNYMFFMVFHRFFIVFCEQWRSEKYCIFELHENGGWLRLFSW